MAAKIKKIPLHEQRECGVFLAVLESKKPVSEDDKLYNTFSMNFKNK